MLNNYINSQKYLSDLSLPGASDKVSVTYKNNDIICME